MVVEPGMGIEAECRAVLGIHSSLNLSDPLLKRKTEKKGEGNLLGCLFMAEASL
jgi:hypothetical protein